MGKGDREVWGMAVRGAGGKAGQGGKGRHRGNGGQGDMGAGR